ncbi:SDR family oxidoreductase [Microbacterium sp. Au-Mic1]|uniref:SDR family NAD(P)-dependent oxidoreductase n=1 Tax=Microbacterium sp. Au-Mic1 TaxID=2906457 RepID=UPI001E5BDED7|nr:SDR family oxidoreductase [Microbacterium sp. Au-Mic1]MCE4026271.1 SDR family oxidoreductase [Microbacterium sp. Au-Mic1]
MKDPRPIAVVVGGGGAIGGAIAAQLAGEYRLALIGRDAGRLAEGAEGFPEPPQLLALDATDGAAVDAAFAQIEAAGPIAALVIAVGTTGGGSLHEIGTDEWRTVVDSNLTTVFETLRAGVSAMIRTGGGAIVVIGSVHGDDPQPGFPAYAAAKAGVHALAKQAAAEYGHLGIRINLVTPGWTRAPHTAGRLDPRDEELLLDVTPLRELVEPTDIAEAVTWLLGPASRRVSGAEIVVDGGSRLLGSATVLRGQYRRRLGLER